MGLAFAPDPVNCDQTFIVRYIIGSFIVISLLFTSQQTAKAQDLVQMSGLVLTSDSLMGVPYASVIIKGSGRGTITNYQGFFSLVAAKGDTLVFSGLGFNTDEYVVSDTITSYRFSIVELLTTGTYYLDETVIFPWPTKEQFREAFLSLNIPDDQLEIARRNLEQQQLTAIGENMRIDGNEGADYYLRKEAQKFSYAGQLPPMNIFNPIAWAQFIQAWKNGDFKKKN